MRCCFSPCCVAYPPPRPRAPQEEWISKRAVPWREPRICEGLSVRSLSAVLFGWVAFAKTALGWWNEEALDCLVGRKVRLDLSRQRRHLPLTLLHY